MRAVNLLERSYYLAAQSNNHLHLQNSSSNKKGPIGPLSLLQLELNPALKLAK